MKQDLLGFQLRASEDAARRCCIAFAIQTTLAIENVVARDVQDMCADAPPLLSQARRRNDIDDASAVRIVLAYPQTAEIRAVYNYVRSSGDDETCDGILATQIAAARPIERNDAPSRSKARGDVRSDVSAGPRYERRPHHVRVGSPEQHKSSCA
jgi:hypothetical protein